MGFVLKPDSVDAVRIEAVGKVGRGRTTPQGRHQHSISRGFRVTAETLEVWLALQE